MTGNVGLVLGNWIEIDEDLARARRISEKLLNWVDSVDSKSKSIEFQHAISSGRFQGYSSLAEIAYLEGEFRVHVSMLRKSIDALPREANGEFAESAELLALISLDELISTIEEDPSKPWMLKYFDAQFMLSRQVYEQDSDNVRLAVNVFLDWADYIRLLWNCDKTEEAKDESTKLKKTN